MAAAALDKPLTEAQKEIARNLPESEIPKNFRCVKGTHLALEAYRLPCCDKPICADCLPSLVDNCPQCSHSPISADSCTPHKSVRKSIKALLSKKEKKLLEAAKNATEATTAAGTPRPADTDKGQPTDAADIAIPTVETPLDAKDGSSVPQSTAVDQGSRSRETSQRPNERSGSVSSQRPSPSTKPENDRGKSAPKDDADDLIMREWRKTHSPKRVLDANTFTYENMGWSATSSAHQQAVQNHMNMNNVRFFPNGAEEGVSGDFLSGRMNGLLAQTPGAMQNLAGLNNANMGLPNMNAMNMNGMMGPGMYPMFGQMDMTGMAGMNTMNSGANFGMAGNNWGGQMLGGDFGASMSGNFPMGGFNQSGGGQFGHMANQFPRNNFPKHNRFQGNGNFAQQRNFGRGSHHPHGNFGFQNQGHNFGPQQMRPTHAVGRIGSQDVNISHFASQNRRPSGSLTIEGSQSAHNPDPSASERKSSKPTNGDIEALESKGDSDKASPVKTVNGKAGTAGSAEAHTIPPDSTPAPEITNSDDNAREANQVTRTANADPSGDTSSYSGELKAIQTIDTVDDEHSATHATLELHSQHNSDAMSGIDNGYSNGPGHSHGYMPRANGYTSTAYGSTTVLTPGEPQGLGVEGAPTGPRAMREGRPNKGFSSRAHRFNAPPSAPSVASVHEAASNEHARGRSKTPERDDSLRIKPKSPSRSRSRSPVKDRDQDRERRRSPSLSRHRKRRHERSRSPSSDDDYERRKEARRHRATRHEDYANKSRDDRYEKSEKTYDRSRSSSPESSKHRSRRDKGHHHSSRRHERSHGHRRSQRSRSRSPGIESRYEDDRLAGKPDINNDSSSHRKSRNEKYRERDRDRDYERDRRDKDRKHDYSRDYDDEYDREYDRKSERDYKKDYDREDRHERSRDKDRDRDKKHSSRRDRSADPHDEYEDDKYSRSTRRSRKDREKEQGIECERERDYDNERDYYDATLAEPRAVSPPLNAPTGPAAETEFKIMGRSKAKKPTTINTSMAPPTGPRSSQGVFQPPKGPAADRARDRPRDARDARQTRDRYESDRDRNDRERDDRDINKDDYHRRGSSISVSHTPTTPATPTVPGAAKFKPSSKDATESKRGDRATDLLMRQMHNRAHGGTAPQISTKRSRGDFETEDNHVATATPSDVHADSTQDRSAEKTADTAPTFAPPTGPAAHRNKRRKSDDANGKSLDTRFTQALRASARGGGAGMRRRGGIKYEGDENEESRAKRVERERERDRWGGR